MEKPYVISAELDLANSATKNIVQTNKVDAFRESLDTDLRKLGKNTLWIASQYLQQGIQAALDQSRLPTVSLDDRYITSADKSIGISRGVDQQLNDSGYTPRVGYPDVSSQLNAIASLGREVAVADDVLFSGEMASWLSDELARRNVKIGTVICGIAIGEGIEKLLALGIDVQAVQAFDDVEDELCERDFAVVPGSGRRIVNRDMNALYFDPNFGKPSAWASIPDAAVNQFAAKSYVRSANILQPGLLMADIGDFYGIKQGSATQTVLDRARQLEQRISS